MYKIVYFGYLLLSIIVFADASSTKEPLAEFSGHGLIKTKPDFISLSLVVRSECEPSPGLGKNLRQYGFKPLVPAFLLSG